MGNTCASNHIALTGTTSDAIEGIVRAYTTLGFERASLRRRCLAELSGSIGLTGALLPVCRLKA